jgi:hypothetical protein
MSIEQRSENGQTDEGYGNGVTMRFLLQPEEPSAV